MSYPTKLSDEQCSYAMTNTEFARDVINATNNVAIVLTQSWCPQWKFMSRWFNDLDIKQTCSLFYIEYDKEIYFEPFMDWKENVLGNRTIPYVRYYVAGKLVAQSNYVSKAVFLSKFN